jgi:hypothetical protein
MDAAPVFGPAKHVFSLPDAAPVRYSENGSRGKSYPEIVFLLILSEVENAPPGKAGDLENLLLAGNAAGGTGSPAISKWSCLFCFPDIA